MVLGLNAYHGDASACLLRDGVLVAAAEWFETDDDVPFMMQVYQIRPGKRALIPAVAHVDGSGRL